jgi:hypothetical protein
VRAHGEAAEEHLDGGGALVVVGDEAVGEAQRRAVGGARAGHAHRRVTGAAEVLHERERPDLDDLQRAPRDDGQPHRRGGPLGHRGGRAPALGGRIAAGRPA